MFVDHFHNFAQAILYFVVLILLAKPLGRYINYIFSTEEASFKFSSTYEKLIYKCLRVDPKHQMNWAEYCTSVIVFGAIGSSVLFLILISQHHLPLNPQNFENLSWHLALNIAVSFITNTNWQAYSGESTLSYFSQMVGLTFQNFVSAATGLSVMLALIRGLRNKEDSNLGNFWVDLVRGTIYILLPLSIFLSVCLVSQGAIQNFSPYINSTTIDSSEEQILPMGPVASQVAIKQLGSNGGGFFNTNSAHPFENPTPLSNFLEMLAILLIPTACFFAFGEMINDRTHSIRLMISMFSILITMFLFCYYHEITGSPKTSPTFEGKEVRLGVVNSTLWAVATTSTSNGSTNSSFDSFSPLGGMIPLIMMQFGEVVIGGVGTGLYSLLMYVVITVFIAGLMIGKTPEYLGKKIGSFEVLMAAITVLLPSAFVLIGTAIAISTDAGKNGMLNPGAQGFSEILYAFTSCANNNGSAFNGLNANTPFYNLMLSIVMIVGRFAVLIPVLAFAGAVSTKKKIPFTVGSLPTNSWLFMGMLIGIIILLGVLTYVPALFLGPLIEYAIMKEV